MSFSSIYAQLDLTYCYHSCIITSMVTTIKIYEETRKKLKLLAAILDKTMLEVLEQLVSEALEKVQSK